ncbi:PD-(D/E)XK nuclease family protein [Rhodanobacter sp. FW106-PBR-R2A-1-13]|uniref:PD-(D/E)XK nuclease family protein n=1 Tax=Rhodanobacter sp. FW106-PBR-R2A-1-13 TaxID=3454845 RepID=UPI0034E5C3D3
METIVLRPTGVMQFERCAEAYRLSTVLGIRTATTSHALAMGKAGHKSILPFVAAHAAGEAIDPVPLFRQAWQEQLDTHVIRFTKHSAKELEEIGSKLTAAFPDVWASSGLTAVVAKGTVLVENRLRVAIEPGLVLSGEPDIVASRGNQSGGGLAIPDAKFASGSAFDGFARVSDQLTAYQLLVRFNAGTLGLADRPVSELGFIEGVKNKEPRWTMQFAAARDDTSLGAYVEKLKMTAALIRKGYFPKRSGNAFESPCGECDFRQLCLDRNPEGYTSAYGDVMDLVEGRSEPRRRGKVSQVIVDRPEDAEAA